MITLVSLKARVKRLNELARGFILDRTRFIRQQSPLRRGEREAYMKALTDAGAVLDVAERVLAAAVKRIETEQRQPGA